MDFGKKNIFLVLISLLVGVAIFIWLGKMIGWGGIALAFKAFKAWQWVFMIVLTFLIAIVGNWRWSEILKDKQVHIPFWRLFRVYLGGYSMMYLFPIIVLSGEIFRIFAIVKEEKIPVTKVAASVIIERVLEWTVNLLAIFFALFFVAFKFSILPLSVLCVFGVALLFFVCAIGYFYFKALRKKSIISGLVKKFSGKEIGNQSNLIEIENEVFEFFQPKNPSLQKGLFLSFLRAGVMLARVWLLIIFLTNVNIGFVAALSVLGFSYFSSLIPIPTALGAHEVIQAAVFGSFGIQASVATAFTMIIRVGELVVSLFGMGFLIKKGFNVMEEKFNNQNNQI